MTVGTWMGTRLEDLPREKLYEIIFELDDQLQKTRKREMEASIARVYDAARRAKVLASV